MYPRSHMFSFERESTKKVPPTMNNFRIATEATGRAEGWESGARPRHTKFVKNSCT